MAGLGWGKQDTGDTAGGRRCGDTPFHCQGAFLRVQKVPGRRNEGEVRGREAPESDGNVCSPTEEGTLGYLRGVGTVLGLWCFSCEHPTQWRAGLAPTKSRRWPDCLRPSTQPGRG